MSNVSTCILYLECYKFFSSQKLLFLSCVASIFSIYHYLFKKFFLICIYFCLCWVLIAMLSFSLVGVSEGCSLVVEHRL